MGGTSSHFADTDWETVDGGLQDPNQTLDGKAPTEAHTILTLRKENLVNQRSFHVFDDVDELVYESKAIEGTTKNFIMLDATGNKIFCVHTDKARVEWTIFSYEPNWEGQEAATPEGLYRKARIDITWNKYHGVVRLFTPSAADPRGDIDMYSSEPSLVCEEIRSHTVQFQSYVPYKSALDNTLHPPLAGWWVWEHTPRRHQLKMHLAKGVDVVLHCIAAITCNMVQVEKQADSL